MRSIEQTFGATPAVVAPRIRLTRRGRLVMHGGATLLLVVLGLVGALFFTGTAEAGEGARAVPVEYHDVLPGETLWAIAAEHAPAADRRETVAEILELNALPSAELSAGQRIALPQP